jgi:hypothetical protein
MKTYRVELTETRKTTIDVEAHDEERARNIAEEQYYAEHSVNDDFSDFFVSDVTHIPEEGSLWGI